MNYKLWGFNILLATVIAVFSFQTYKTWTAPQETIPETTQETSTKKSLPKLIQFNLPPESVFEDVARKQLFSEKRQEKIIPETPTEEVEVEVKEAIVSGKKIILYGVIITGDVKKAMIQNPVRKKGDPEYLWVREGEKLHNLVIKTIQPDKILLTEKGNKLVVLLHDKESPKIRSTSPQAKNKESKQPKSTDQPNKKPQSQHVTTSTASTPTKGENSTAEAEYETIETPFGTFRREKK